MFYSAFSENMEELEYIKFVTAPVPAWEMDQLYRQNNEEMWKNAAKYHIKFRPGEWGRRKEEKFVT